MHFKNILYFFCTCTLLSSCQKKLKNNSSDFTKEFEFTKGIEGPAVDRDGTLYAVNYKEEGTIGKVAANGKASLFITLPKGSIGNGIRFDKNGTMYIADYTKHSILQIKKGETTVQIYAQDTTMNQPNDLAIAPNGILYASDPNWANNSGNLWMARNNRLVLLESNMGTTNGIEVSPKGKFLYVNESVQRKIWRYEIDANNKPKNKTLFTSFTDFGLDGMRCDAKGNLYVCRYGKGTVVMLSTEGKIIREIQLKGTKPSNITFGGKNLQQCFVTMADRGNFETFTAEFPGRSF
ncbi:MAG: SMP-30/gluconolactonase/LRE family protein [Flavobacteriaceae bacterium]|nr:SMP-30/gluconolactonase/LRE family protein [Flavobacteriaceae bacterium]